MENKTRNWRIGFDFKKKHFYGVQKLNLYKVTAWYESVFHQAHLFLTLLRPTKLKKDFKGFLLSGR